MESAMLALNSNNTNGSSGNNADSSSPPTACAVQPNAGEVSSAGGGVLRELPPTDRRNNKKLVNGDTSKDAGADCNENVATFKAAETEPVVELKAESNEEKSTEDRKGGAKEAPMPDSKEAAATIGRKSDSEQEPQPEPNDESKTSLNVKVPAAHGDASGSRSPGMDEEQAAGREILKAEMRLRAEHRATVSQLVEQQQEKERRYKQLLEVLEKSSLYAKVIVERIEEEKLAFEKRLARRQQQEAAASVAPAEPSPTAASDSAASDSAADNDKKGRRHSVRVRTRASVKRTRPADEDGQEPTEDVVSAQSAAKRRRPNPAEQQQQPQVLVDSDGGRLDLFTGHLRDYQLEGFDWLRRMYENGINGILGDEMGLGKTVQCIAFVAHLVAMGVSGPFFVVGPLSTLCNWRAEFARFAPAIPVVLYHGSKDRCAQLRRDMHSTLPVAGCEGATCYPVVITSYEMAIRDRYYFQRFVWKLLIVDEGHRVKNFQCRLARELRMYPCTHRLILTGTPIQNNLTELWSLLNFLLPDIFKNLGTFEAWFDAGVLQDAQAKRRLLEREEEHRVLSVMHQILLPFMLRRCKADVDLEVPPKRDRVLYASLTAEQASLYRMAVDRTIRALLGDDAGSDESAFQAAAAAAAAAGPRRAKLRSSRLSQRMLAASERDDDGGGNGDDDASGAENNGIDFDEEDAVVMKAADLDAPGGGGSGTFEEAAEVKLNMRNPMAILKRICNHPYLVRYPLTPDGQYRIDEDLVRVSGKFRLLDRLLPALLRDGHKVLIFSQWICILDLLQDYCHLRQFNFSRLDGGMSLEDRDSEISRFYKEANTCVFLVTTRAGGLGLNLTPADTVIIFDSDWNPQADLQAQDRCHRIGQTVPVLVFRLVTADSIDERIVSRADAKRTLERMIISRSKFRRSLTREALEQAKLLDKRELEDLLLTTASAANGCQTASNEEEVLPDGELAQLLDRSELLAEWHRLRAERRAKDAAATAK